MAAVIDNSVYMDGGRGGGGGQGANFDEDRKLFLGGLSWDTTENDLQEYFGQFGQVANVSIKYNAQTGNPRGFGFITFTDDQSIESVLSSGPHSVKNKIIDPRKAKSKLNANLKKIFVGGVDSNMSEEELRDYFSRFGRVDGIELPFDKIRNRRREFCFIIFDTKEAADAACSESKQFIGGRECDIKRAQPQNNAGGGGGMGGMGGMGMGGMGGGGGHRNGGGMGGMGGGRSGGMNGAGNGMQYGGGGGAGGAPYHSPSFQDYGETGTQNWGYQSQGSYGGGAWNAGGPAGGMGGGGGGGRNGSGGGRGPGGPRGGPGGPGGAGGGGGGFHRSRVYTGGNSGNDNYGTYN